MEREFTTVGQVDKFALACLERTKDVYVGIDPGVSGAIAFVCGPDYLVIDMPVYTVSRTRSVKIPKKAMTPGGPKTKTVKGETSLYDFDKIVEVFKALRPVRRRVHACVEIAKPMVNNPAWKGKGRFKGSANIRTAYLVGVGFGMWPLFLAQKGYPREEVEPAVWKKALGLTGKDKDASLKKAKAWFPKAALTAKKHHGRAEALLLAEYYRRLREQQGQPGGRRRQP